MCFSCGVSDKNMIEKEVPIVFIRDVGKKNDVPTNLQTQDGNTKIEKRYDPSELRIVIEGLGSEIFPVDSKDGPIEGTKYYPFNRRKNLKLYVRPFIGSFLLRVEDAGGNGVPVNFFSRPSESFILDKQTGEVKVVPKPEGKTYIVVQLETPHSLLPTPTSLGLELSFPKEFCSGVNCQFKWNDKETEKFNLELFQKFYTKSGSPLKHFDTVKGIFIPTKVGDVLTGTVSLTEGKFGRADRFVKLCDDEKGCFVKQTEEVKADESLAFSVKIVKEGPFTFGIETLLGRKVRIGVNCNDIKDVMVKKGEGLGSPKVGKLKIGQEFFLVPCLDEEFGKDPFRKKNKLIWDYIEFVEATSQTGKQIPVERNGNKWRLSNDFLGKVTFAIKTKGDSKFSSTLEIEK
jgi:hypothetical protein